MDDHILDVLLEFMSELDHNSQTFCVTGMIYQVAEVIDVFIYYVTFLEVARSLQFGEGHLYLILWTKLGNEHRPEL
jgi:hypothetical protein